MFEEGRASEQPGAVDPDLGGRGEFRIPDVRGVGIAYHPFDELVVAFDWNRVEYSDMSDDLINLLRAGRGERRFFRAADADELHLGLEYQLLRTRLPVSFGWGGWSDPDQRLRYSARARACATRSRRARRGALAGASVW